MNRLGFGLVSILLVALLLSSTMFIVDQRQFAVVSAFGEVKHVITEPGLKFKLPPPLQQVLFLDRRIQTLDSPQAGQISTAEKKNLVIDWLIKWRLTDPLQFIRNNAGSNRGIDTRLIPIVHAAFNDEVTKRTVQAMLATDRDSVMQDVRKRLIDEVKPFGIEIIDVRIKRVDFAASITASIYSRMESERKRVANELRSTGMADGEKIRADADKQVEVILAQAYADAQKIMGEGDAKASTLYAEAFGKDPQFAHFYRSLDAYKTSFGSKSDVLVVDPNTEFFKAMRGAGAAKP